MKIRYLILISAVLMLFMNIQSISNAAEIKKDTGYISLNGTKSIETDPNTARITFSVETTASSAQKAVSENNEISAKILNALKLMANAETDTLRTSNFSVKPIYSTNSAKHEIKNYVAINVITAETKEIKKVSEFIDTAIANGANRTEGLYYSYENGKNICNDMYSELMKELKEQASAIATASNSTLDGIKYVNANCNINSPVSNGRIYAKALMSNSAASEDAIQSTPIEPAKVKINSYLNAEFYIK